MDMPYLQSEGQLEGRMFFAEQRQQGAAPQSSLTSATANFSIPEDAELEEPEIFLDDDFSDEDSVAVCFTAVGNIASCVSSQE